MAIFEKIGRWVVAKREVGGPENGSPAAVVSAARAAANFGTVVDNGTALKITALYAGIRLRSENAASLPKSVKKTTADGQAIDRTHPAFHVINVRPNSYTNVFNFWSTIFTWLDGWGNAYAIILRDSSGRPAELHQVHPSCVRVTMQDGRKWYKVSMSNPNLNYLNGTYSDDDMLHFILVSLDGVLGINPVIYNAAALGKSVAVEKFAAEFFAKGGNIRGVMETEQNLGDDEYEAFMRHYELAAGNFETPILEYGIKYKQLPVDPICEKLIESEIFSVQDVCRILNIPPHMLAELSRSTFSNIEHQNIQFVQYSLRPTIKRVEVELESKLFFERERADYSVKFELDGLLRGDTTTRSTYYHNAILDGYMSRNEVRQLEGLQKLEGLDEMLYPLNTGIVGKETEQTNNV